MIRLKIDDRQLTEMTKQLQDRSRNTLRLMRAIAGDIEDSIEQNFEDEGRPAWRLLSPQRIRERKRVKKWPGPILQVTGRLAGSMNQRVTNRTAMVGTNVDYARIHQFGGSAGRGGKSKIPARPFLKLQPKEIDKIKERVIRHLLRSQG